MSLTVKHCFIVGTRDVNGGDLLEVTLASGAKLVLTARQDFFDAPCRFVLVDPWMPRNLVDQTEAVALIMLRRSPIYSYGHTRLSREQVRDFARAMRRETVVLETAYVHEIQMGAWLSGRVELDPDLDYPERISLRWRAPSPVALVRPLVLPHH
jgi:hypothetical protein